MILQKALKIIMWCIGNTMIFHKKKILTFTFESDKKVLELMFWENWSPRCNEQSFMSLWKSWSTDLKTWSNRLRDIFFRNEHLSEWMGKLTLALTGRKHKRICGNVMLPVSSRTKQYLNYSVLSYIRQFSQ